MEHPFAQHSLAGGGADAAASGVWSMPTFLTEETLDPDSPVSKRRGGKHDLWQHFEVEIGSTQRCLRIGC